MHGSDERDSDHSRHQGSVGVGSEFMSMYQRHISFFDKFKEVPHAAPVEHAIDREHMSLKPLRRAFVVKRTWMVQTHDRPIPFVIQGSRQPTDYHLRATRG